MVNLVISDSDGYVTVSVALCESVCVYLDIYIYIHTHTHTQWKPLIMIILGPVLFDNNNRLITLSGGYKNLHYLTQFIVTIFYMYKKQNLFEKLCSVACCLFAFSSS
jgi:hypothetical protein